MTLIDKKNELAPAVADLVKALSLANKKEHAECLAEAKRLGDSLEVNSGERLTWQHMTKLLRAERRRFSE